MNDDQTQHDEKERAWYDTKRGIHEALVNLEDFRGLLSERHKAGYDRDEKLNEFYVFGRYWMNTCGDCGKISGWIPKENIPSIPDVLTKGEFFLFIRENVVNIENLSWSSGIGSDLPYDGAICPVCNKGWTIDNCHDTVVKESWKIDDCHDTVVVDEYELNSCFYHSVCNHLNIAVREEEQFRGMFQKAGFQFLIFNHIPNGHCPCHRCGPWFRVETEIGTITLGWRKRVIHIDWSETVREGKKILPLFAEEDVTKGVSFIHAWSYNKAVQYLSKIHEELSAA